MNSASIVSKVWSFSVTVRDVAVGTATNAPTVPRRDIGFGHVK